MDKIKLGRMHAQMEGPLGKARGGGHIHGAWREEYAF